jgi:hypothetical protein
MQVTTTPIPCIHRTPQSSNQLPSIPPDTTHHTPAPPHPRPTCVPFVAPRAIHWPPPLLFGVYYFLVRPNMFVSLVEWLCTFNILYFILDTRDAQYRSHLLLLTPSAIRLCCIFRKFVACGSKFDNSIRIGSNTAVQFLCTESPSPTFGGNYLWQLV